MISETWDYTEIAEVANHPAVFPWICGRRGVSFDFVGAVKDRNNIFLFGEFGGFYFRNLNGRVFDAHSMVLPGGRGFWALQAAEAALDWMFSRTDAQEIMMSVPKGNLAVRALVKKLGAKLRGTIPNGWVLNGKEVAVDVYSMMKEDWKCR
jgi:hypothetical protein